MKKLQILKQCSLFKGIDPAACALQQEIDLNVVATEITTILFLDISHLIRSCQHSCSFHHKIIQNLLSIVSNKNVLLTQKIHHLTRRTTQEKILSYLNSQALKNNSLTFEIPFNRQQLADYLAVERSALSSELSKLQKNGIIAYKKNFNPPLNFQTIPVIPMHRFIKIPLLIIKIISLTVFFY